MKAEIRVMLLQAKEPPEVAGKPPETKKGPGTDLSLPARMESTTYTLILGCWLTDL